MRKNRTAGQRPTPQDQQVLVNLCEVGAFACAIPRRSHSLTTSKVGSPHRSPEAGMTLLEVLIAVTLFGILSVGILMALRVGLNAMERSDDRLMHNRREAYASRILQAQLTGFIPQIAL